MRLFFFSLQCILLFVIVSSDTLTCPTGFTFLNSNNNKCVRLFTDPVKHSDAAANCSSYGGHLVSIANAIDNRYLVNFVSAKSGNPFWIGIKCSETNNAASCIWDDQSGNAGSYNNFANGYPFVDVGKCVYVPVSGSASGRWLSADCELMNLNYICEATPSSPNTETCPYQHNGFCYYPLVSSLAEKDAQFACEQECANLVSIHSDEENRFVQSLFSNNLPAYIRIGALTNSQNRNTWIDGSVWDYANIGYSNTNLGFCMSMALRDEIVGAGKWMSSKCDTPVPFVCKREAGYQCTTVGPTLAPGDCSGPMFYDNSGTFFSPNWPYSYIGEQNRCSYVLDTPIGSLAQIQFPVMNLDPQSSIAVYSRIEDTTPLVVFEGNSASNTWYNSTTNTMKVVFRPCLGNCNTNGVFRWQANFQPSNPVTTLTPPVTVTPDVNNPSGCNSTVLVAPGLITSPNYPNFYPNFLNCMYHLSTSGGYRIRLDFGHVETEQCCDVIVIHDGPFLGSTEIGRLSGSIPAHSKIYQSTSNSMLVTFSTDASGQGSGFTANFGAY
uniref:C-type LECtin n=1 Tax=Caenorhabditis japonica TaxID=281687 RepID=A0A8R1I4P2_CAEJA